MGNVASAPYGLAQTSPALTGTIPINRAQELAQAAQLLSGREWEQAELILRNILVQDKASAPAMELLGVIRAHQGNSAESERLFRESLRLDPSFASTHANLAHLLAITGRADEALEEYRLAVHADPKDKIAIGGFVGLVERQTEADRVKGNNGNALGRLLYARKSLPHEARLAFDFGGLAMEIGLNLEGDRALKEAYELEPDNAMYLFAYARAEFTCKQSPSAEYLMREYLKRVPDDATAHFTLGRILQTLGQDAEASTEFERSIELEPHQTESFFQLGEIDLEQGNLSTATTRFEKVVAANPRHEEAFTGLGIVAYRQKQYKEAAEYLKTAIDISPDNSLAHYYYGLTQKRLGQQEEATKELELAERLIEAVKSSQMTHREIQSLPVPGPDGSVPRSPKK
jgi:tetratricopeptide (TPR) repeat protein